MDDEAFFQARARPVGRADLETRQPPGDRQYGATGSSPQHFQQSTTQMRGQGVPPASARRVFDHVWTGAGGDINLLLYDVTTLYFEAEKDDLRKSGYSKERRVDPQILVGLLVDRTGLLEIACFEGSKAETLAILPVVQAFQERHQVADMVVVADAGMLSAKSLQDIDEAQLRFIVGSTPRRPRMIWSSTSTGTGTTGMTDHRHHHLKALEERP
ncbi:MAG: transposase [Tessaracoccus sp.]